MLSFVSPESYSVSLLAYKNSCTYSDLIWRRSDAEPRSTELIPGEFWTMRGLQEHGVIR